MGILSSPSIHFENDEGSKSDSQNLAVIPSTLLDNFSKEILDTFNPIFNKISNLEERIQDLELMVASIIAG